VIDIEFWPDCDRGPLREDGREVPPDSLDLPVLADTHDEWATDEPRYLSEESMAKIGTTNDNDTVAFTRADR
jgi:hypothetical protein